MKQRYGTDAPPSCHTIVMDGYTVEYHVPAAEIKKSLKEKPNAKSIAVLGMPANSPSMGEYQTGTIAVVLIGKDGSVKTYGNF